MKEAKIERITTGFLTGNLFGSDVENVDQDASATKYYTLLIEELEKQYPDIEVEVNCQDAEGCVPSTLKTHVYFEDEDADDCFEVEESVILNIDEIQGAVWERQEEWLVYTEGENDE